MLFFKFSPVTVTVPFRYFSVTVFTLASPIVHHSHRPTFLSVPNRFPPFSLAPNRFPQTVPDHFLPILTDFNVKEYFLEKLIIFAKKLGPLRYFIFKFFELILWKTDNKRSLNQSKIIFLKSSWFKALNTFYQLYKILKNVSSYFSFHSNNKRLW